MMALFIRVRFLPDWVGISVVCGAIFVWSALAASSALLAASMPWWIAWVPWALAGGLFAPASLLVIGLARRRLLLTDTELVYRGWPGRPTMVVARAGIQRVSSVAADSADLQALLWLIFPTTTFWELSVRMRDGEVVRLERTLTARRASVEQERELNRWIVQDADDTATVEHLPARRARHSVVWIGAAFVISAPILGLVSWLMSEPALVWISALAACVGGLVLTIRWLLRGAAAV